MIITASTAEIFEDCQKKRYAEFLKELGTDISFESDLWCCENKRRYPYEEKTRLTLYFSNIPESYKELVKYFAILRILNGVTVRAVKTDISGLGVFCSFMEGSSKRIEEADSHLALGFRAYLDGRGYSLTSRSRTWGTVGILFSTMVGFGGIGNRNPFHKNPYPSHVKREYKLVPEHVVSQLDTVFMKEDIHLEIRLMYWILRLIPSRINEVLSMRLDCFKAYMEDYVLFIPTWKQNGGHKEPVLRSIHIRKEGMGEFLINLLSEQQVKSQKMQEELKESERGALFTYRRQLSICDGSRVNTECYGVLQLWAAAYHLKEICKKYGLRDDQGKEYLLSSHQLRHNGITDRLAEGFTIEQVAEMTGHHGEAMIWDSYAHLGQRQEQMLEKQRQVIKEPAAAPYIFGGRIMHMEKELEERLLKNLRAHKVRGGICSDISGCKGDMWNCLECSSFIPDKDQIGYYREQIKDWEEKSRRFAAFPVMKQNAIRNAGLFQKIIDRMESEGNQDGRQTP